MSTDFQYAITVDELVDPGTLMIEIKDRLVVIVHLEGEFYCIDDVCTHDSGPLSDGELQGCQLICPRHGAKFDVRTGQALTFPAILATMAHEVKVDDGNVYVKINGQ
jgi:3-phenylpropionate/trans-cinnamate dioxygenase ferredoxin component